MRLALVQDGGAQVTVVGHVEWVQFARVSHVPRVGEVAHALDPFEEPAGGGAVAAVQLARLAGASRLFTVLGGDDEGECSCSRLADLGVEVRASISERPTRRAVTLVEDSGERTITTFGERLDPLGSQGDEYWSGIEEADGIYFTAGDLDALALARRATGVLVASPRARHALGGGVRLDALVLSGDDEIELREAKRADGEADIVIYTEGAVGGRYRERSGAEGRWQAADLPGSPVDSYGCGDSFAAGLTYGLAAGQPLGEALALAARCGAMCLTGRGPYQRQLSAHDL